MPADFGSFPLAAALASAFDADEGAGEIDFERTSAGSNGGLSDSARDGLISLDERCPSCEMAIPGDVAGGVTAVLLFCFIKRK